MKFIRGHWAELQFPQEANLPPLPGAVHSVPYPPTTPQLPVSLRPLPLHTNIITKSPAAKISRKSLPRPKPSYCEQDMRGFANTCQINAAGACRWHAVEPTKSPRNVYLRTT